MLYLYNHLSRKKEKFKPIKNRRAGLYTCGPTVYDRVHIGNLKTYVFEDVLKKTIALNGFKTRHVMNITDVDDKIIKKTAEQNKSLGEITDFYLKLFLEDARKLNIEKPNYLPKATEHIQEMIALIKKLEKRGYIYKNNDGSVYFRISKFKKYGKLSGINRSEIKKETRIENDEYNKENIGDFAVWKARKGNEPYWDSEFGPGRPGWHIECSAMSMKYLGETFDIHAGAIDLLFPHHENEIAQSEAATGKKFVNFWLEGGHLLVNNQKMSKSLNNFYTLEDIEKNGIHPLMFRYLVLNSHYRSNLNFTWESLKSAEEALKKLRAAALKKSLWKPAAKRDAKKETTYKKKFTDALNDDLNTPVALAVLWEMTDDNSFPETSKKALFKEFDKILSLNLETSVKIPAETTKLILRREKYRKNKNWAEADKIRALVSSQKWIIEDTDKGPAIYPSD